MMAGVVTVLFLSDIEPGTQQNCSVAFAGYRYIIGDDSSKLGTLAF
jgi:hypothetical protein